MIVICEECGQKYRLDAAVQAREEARFKCKSCSHVITFAKHPPAKGPELPEELQAGDLLPPEPPASPESTEIEDSPAPAAKGMGLRAKMVLLFTVIPMVIFGLAGFLYMQQMNRFADLMTHESTRVVTTMGEQNITDVARLVARQIKQYLDANPGLQPTDFMRDADFKKIAVQKVGQTGYTALHSVGPMVNWAHPNPKVVGRPVTELVRKPLGNDFPRWQEIVKELDQGQNIEKTGYYPWTDPNGEVREKFMVLAPVEGTGFGVAATIYMDEFTQPIDQVGRNAAQITASVRTYLLMGLIGALVLIGLIVTVYGNNLANTIKALTTHAERISVGELDSELKITARDEIGQLGEAITRMQESIRLSLERLRKRRH